MLPGFMTGTDGLRASQSVCQSASQHAYERANEDHCPDDDIGDDHSQLLLALHYISYEL